MQNKIMNEDLFSHFNRDLIFYLNTELTLAGDYRLDPSHYISSQDANGNNSLEYNTLASFVESIEEPNLFTRYYCDSIYGTPYISSSEMSEIDPPLDKRFISNELTKNISQYLIKRGQVLVSAAGTVGSIVVATEELNGVAGTSDILRINFNHSKNRGFIFTYLTSEHGSRELSNLAYGAIIKRVRGFQLSNLKVPIIDTELIDEIDKLIDLCLTKREQACRCIKLAQDYVLQYNNLPPLSLDDIETLDPQKGTQIQLISSNEFTKDYRLDAHFYNPVAKRVLNNIFNFSKKYLRLTDGISQKTFYLNRFTRTFVEKEYGLPYLAGKDIMKVRPSEVSYLSSSETHDLDDYKLERGWILLTCSGTLGRTCYIHKNYESWVCTHDMIRIVCNTQYDSGYLYAFLSSEYGFHQLVRYKHGAVIDHLTPEQVAEIYIPIPSKNQQKEIGDMIRKAYDLRAEAIKLEDEAQEILTKALTE